MTLVTGGYVATTEGLRRLHRRWQAWRILHAELSLIWRSRLWRWRLVRWGVLPLPSPDQGSPPLTPRDLLRLRRPDTTEWDNRRALHDAWWEEHRHEYEVVA